MINMKMPKKIKTMCPYCKKHTEHKVKTVKKKARSKAHPLSQSVKRFNRKIKGYGSFPRPNPSGEGKPTKKVDMRLECAECKKQHTKKGYRVKKFELTSESGG